MVSMDRNVTSIARALKLDWLRNWGSEVKEHLGKLFILNVDIYRTVIRIQAALSYVDRGPQLEAFILEDAIGRTAPVTLQFITSWEALDGVLETRFRNLQGHAKIVSKEFVLQERITRRDVSRDGPWEGAILPGQKIEMSIVFTDARNDKQTSCPGCQQACEIHSESGIQWYERLVSLSGLLAHGISLVPVVECGLVASSSCMTMSPQTRQRRCLKDRQNKDSIQSKMPSLEGRERLLAQCLLGPQLSVT